MTAVERIKAYNAGEEFGLDSFNVGLGLKTIGGALGSTLAAPEHGIDYVAEHMFDPVGTNFSDPVTCMDVISKKQFDEFSLPYIKKLIDGTEKIMGSRPGAHICGKTAPIWNDLADAGLFSFSIDNCEDLEVAKKAVGDRMRIAGNVPPIEVMKEGTICDRFLQRMYEEMRG